VAVCIGEPLSCALPIGGFARGHQVARKAADNPFIPAREGGVAPKAIVSAPTRFYSFVRTTPIHKAGARP
jgi:hypothetical protein